MQKSLMGVLVFSGVLVGACTMKAPHDVSQAASTKGAAPKGLPAASLAAVPERATNPTTAVAAQLPATRSLAKTDQAPKAAAKPVEGGTAAETNVAVSADGKEARADKATKPEIKSSKLAKLGSVVSSLPLPMLSMMRGEDGRISPMNMVMKIRSMMPMCAGNSNCVTTSTGFQRVSIKEPAKPLAVAAAD